MTQQKVSALNTLLLSLCTLILSGLFAFCWRTNTQVTILVDHDAVKANTIDNIQKGVDQLRLNVNDIQLRLTRVEDKQTQNQTK